jgi:lipoprotein-anchoring transpeptidase ErfK/SrfK
MLRFVIGLLAVVSVYLGWQWYSDKSSHAGVAGPADLAFEAASEGASAGPSGPANAGKGTAGKGTSGPGTAAKQEAIRSTVPLQASDPGKIVQGIAAADEAVLEIGFQRLLEAQEPQRGKLAAALRKAADGATDVAGQMRVLGRANGFLHSTEGRKLVRKVLAGIKRLDREKAIVKSTLLLEKCMRGPIKRKHNEAFDLVNEVYRHHKRLVNQVTFNPSRLTKARSHKVKSGETLNGIAAKYRKDKIRIEGWTLCYVNRIGRPNRLQAGKTIKIPVEPVWAKLEKESYLMAVYIGDTIVRLYWVGHGGDGCSTPETTFQVADKLSNPDWYAPDGNTYAFGHPKNVLGRYFVKFAHDSFSGFGAHGTAAPETVRTRSSLGCIRMHDADIEEFFRLVPRGSKIVIAASR